MRQFVFKVHGRCDLACDYCYVFEMADQRWRDRPRAMSRRVAEVAVDRVAEHVRAHDLAEVDLVFHGGEPLLAGIDFLEWLAVCARRRIPASVRISVQTNGVRLDRGFLDMFRRQAVRVGVSLDGNGEAHDRHRRRGDGRGSHVDVANSLALLAGDDYRDLFAGLLCVVDLRNDPLATYHALLGYSPPVIDFLLPHGTWSSPPPHLAGRSGGTPYADWMVTIFDDWYTLPGQETAVRFFDEVIALWLGGRSRVEGLGHDPSPQLVIETDGSIERSDILAAAYSGAGATGLHVDRDPIDAAVSPAPDRPCGTCLECAVFPVCGGGQRTHRFRAGSGFANPSVYCSDLYRFITHVRARLAADLERVT